MKLDFNGRSLCGNPIGKLVRLGSKCGRITSTIYPPESEWSDEVNAYMPTNAPYVMVGVVAFDGEYYEWDAQEVEVITSETLLGD